MILQLFLTLLCTIAILSGIFCYAAVPDSKFQTRAFWVFVGTASVIIFIALNLLANDSPPSHPIAPKAILMDAFNFRHDEPLRFIPDWSSMTSLLIPFGISSSALPDESSYNAFGYSYSTIQPFIRLYPPRGAYPND